MNERIMEAVREIEAIRDTMGREYAWKNAEGKTVLECQYFYSDNRHIIPKERAISDRSKMLDVLRRFFLAHSDNHDGMDDFVTLFGVYCNHYIRFNLHQAIQGEGDFGIHALWDTVTDKKMQAYLDFLRKGISNGIGDYNTFFDAGEMFPEYSLPYLYLYIHDLIHYSSIKDDMPKDWDEYNFRKGLLLFYTSMNQALRNYCLGCSPFISHDVGSDFVDSNPLPYVRVSNYLERVICVSAMQLTNKIQNQCVTKSDLENFANPILCSHLENREQRPHLPVSSHWGTWWRDKDEMPSRLEFLSIPYTLNWGNGALIMAMDYMAKQDMEAREKEAVQQEKDEIVQDFSHTYQNMGATTLYQVAMTLLSRTNDEDLALGRTALLEYTRKETLTKDVYMMKLKYEHNTEKLRGILRQSCISPSSTTHTLHKVAHQALLTALISAFYDEGQGNAVAMFDNLSTFWPSMEEIVLSFEKEVIQHEMDCLVWLKTKGIDLCMEEAEPWLSVGFVPNGYSEVLLRNILTELFVNLFKYGDLKQKILLSFRRDNKSGDALPIRMDNYLLDGKRGTSNSQVGLHAMGKMLRVLWGDKEDEERIAMDYVGDKFIICLWLPLSVFSVKGEEK